MNREIPPPLPPSRFSKRLVWILVVVGVLGGLAIGSQPLYRGMKRWRARRFASQAQQFVLEQRWEEAFRKAQAAYQLSPQDPETLRSVAQLYSKLGQDQAFSFWNQLLDQKVGTLDDRKEMTELALRLQRLDIAEPLLSQLLQSAPDDSQVLKLQAEFLLFKGDAGKAVQFAERAAEKNSAQPEPQLFLAKVLAVSSDPAGPIRAKQILLKLSAANQASGLQALALAAQMPNLTPEETRQISERLRTHPSAGLDEQLLAIDLGLRVEPGDPAVLVGPILKTNAIATAAAKLGVGRWLNRHRLHSQTLQIVPSSMSQTNSDLFLVRADALAALHQWPVLKALIEKDNCPLEAPLRELYLARIARELNESESAARHWRRLNELEPELKPPVLLYIAQYAEQTGERAQAANAYARLTQTPATAREAYLALVRIGEEEKNTGRLRELMREMISRFPDDPAPRNDLAYLNLLLSENIEMAKQIGQSLFQQNTNMLAYRTTLALAHLRLNEPGEAKKLYDQIDVNWSAIMPSWQAVHAAVCGANGATNLARTLARQIPLAALKPEEKELIQPYL